MRQPARDLFGEVPVTHQEVHQWVRVVARLDPESQRGVWYARAYSVVEKIAAHKLAECQVTIIDP